MGGNPNLAIDSQVRSLAQQNLPMLTQQLRTASGIAGL